VAGGAIFVFHHRVDRGPGGVAEHDAGIASGLLTPPADRGAIGVAVASTVAATHSRLPPEPGGMRPPPRFYRRVPVGVLVLAHRTAAIPVTFLLIRRTELARAVAASLQREPSVAAAD